MRARPTKPSIHPTAVLGEGVAIGAGTRVGPYSVLGERYRRVNGRTLPARAQTVVGPDCEIGPHARLLRGTHVGRGTTIDGGCTIEQDVDIGRDCRLIYHAIVCNYVRIGDSSIVGGFLGEGSRIGRSSRVFGQLVHRQDDPAVPWDENDEEPPVLEDHVFVAFGAVVIGGVRIGRRSFVCAGAQVTRDVPSRHVVVGNGEAHRYSSLNWKLTKSRWFSDA